MKRSFVSVLIAAIVASYSIPGAAALSLQKCTTDHTGKKVCKSHLPRAARIGIAVGAVVLFLLLLVVVFVVIRRRRRAVAAQEEYGVDASQVDGPATIVDTAYHRRSGMAAVYSGGGRGTPEMSGPSFPVAAQLPYGDPTRVYTAPANRAQFSRPEMPQYSAYPFTGPGSTDRSGNVMNPAAQWATTLDHS